MKQFDTPFSTDIQKFITGQARVNVPSDKIALVLQLSELTGETPADIATRYKKLEREVRRTVYNMSEG